jgi:hypothetical protein
MREPIGCVNPVTADLQEICSAGGGVNDRRGARWPSFRECRPHHPTLEDASECQQRLEDRGVRSPTRRRQRQAREGFTLSQSFSVLGKKRSTDDATSCRRCCRGRAALRSGSPARRGSSADRAVPSGRRCATCGLTNWLASTTCPHIRPWPNVRTPRALVGMSGRAGRRNQPARPATPPRLPHAAEAVVGCGGSSRSTRRGRAAQSRTV